MLVPGQVCFGQPQARLAAVWLHGQGALAPVHGAAGATRRQAHRRDVQVHCDAVAVDLRLSVEQTRAFRQSRHHT